MTVSSAAGADDGDCSGEALFVERDAPLTSTRISLCSPAPDWMFSARENRAEGNCSREMSQKATQSNVRSNQMTERTEAMKGEKKKEMQRKREENTKKRNEPEG